MSIAQDYLVYYCINFSIMIPSLCLNPVVSFCVLSIREYKSTRNAPTVEDIDRAVEYTVCSRWKLGTKYNRTRTKEAKKKWTFLVFSKINK